MSPEDFLAKMLSNLLLNFLIRVIEALWKNAGGDEVAVALLARAQDFGRWSAIWSAIRSIVAMCEPPSLGVQAYIASRSFSFFATFAATCIVGASLPFSLEGYLSGAISGTIYGLAMIASDVADGLFIGPMMLVAVIIPRRFFWVMVASLAPIPLFVAFAIVCGYYLSRFGISAGAAHPGIVQNFATYIVTAYIGTYISTKTRPALYQLAASPSFAFAKRCAARLDQYKADR